MAAAETVQPPLKVLVTGANGFVGRAVCAELARCGHEVRAAVRSVDRAPYEVSVVVPVGGLGPETDWSRAVEGVDAVIHLAARVHVMRETATDGLAAFRTVNVGATRALARAAAVHAVKRFVFVSSIKVNGEATSREPFRPDDPALPEDPYGMSKWEAEQALWEIARETGLEAVVVRPPLVYGPGVGGNFVRLLRLARSGLPLPFGSIDNRRSMIYVRNLSSALVACAVHVAAPGSTFLVSDGVDMSTADLVRRLAVAMGVPPRLWRLPPGLLRAAARLAGKTEEIDRLTGSLVVDGSRLSRTLDWTPPFKVDAGLRDTAEWFCDACRGHG